MPKKWLDKVKASLDATSRVLERNKPKQAGGSRTSTSTRQTSGQQARMDSIVRANEIRKRKLAEANRVKRGNVHSTKGKTTWFHTLSPSYIRNKALNRLTPLDRFDVLSKLYPKYSELTIPFIKSKRKTLHNAGLATGAIISENLLDSIAKYANIEGLPLKQALGLSVKESTLGNPTDDKSIIKLLGEAKANFYKRGGGRQFINKEGQDVDARRLVNYYKDTWNPYENAISVAKKKVLGDSRTPFYPPNNWGDENNPYYRKALQEYLKNKQAIDSILISGERYANNIANKQKPLIQGNVLQAAFRDYKNNPNNYNPGQTNYVQLVNKRGEEILNSPEVKDWYSRYIHSYKHGGKIYIKPENRGKFNALKKRTGKTTEELTHSKNPLTRKRAIFAQNAAKWNHK